MDFIMRIRPFVNLGILCLGLLAGGSQGTAQSQADPTPVSAQPADGTLEIFFLFNKAEGVVPSYQIAIWLEDEEGKYVKTLFVSQYLAGSGLVHEGICPDWVKQAHWEKVDEAEFDAVTRPTPPMGANAMKFDCQKKALRPGMYRFCVQAHINEDYNILYRGKVSLGQDASEGRAEAFYSPKKHPLASEILCDVRAKYVPGKENNSSIEKDKP
jgi:hypothetical protein